MMHDGHLSVTCCRRRSSYIKPFSMSYLHSFSIRSSIKDRYKCGDADGVAAAGPAESKHPGRSTASTRLVQVGLHQI